MKEYKNKLGGLADKLKSTAPETPLQEVNPVKLETSIKEEEAQLNVWIPKGLLKQMKNHGVDHDLSLKDMTIKALKFYFQGHLKELHEALE